MRAALRFSLLPAYGIGAATVLLLVSLTVSPLPLWAVLAGAAGVLLVAAMAAGLLYDDGEAELPDTDDPSPGGP